MYDKRIKIFIILSAALLVVCLLRLAQMQLLADSSLQEKIAELKRQRGRFHQLKTIRGKILDRNGKVLAVDEPRFGLYIDYKLTSLTDERVTSGQHTQYAIRNTQYEHEDLQQIINKCAQFRGVEPAQIRNEIQKINDFVWDRRTFQAWRNNFGDSEVFKNYNDIISIPLSQAISDFEKKEPDPAKRFGLVNKVDIAEMHKNWPLLELKTDDDIFNAQLEFMNIDGVRILLKAHRFYPFGAAAAQTMGWVGRPQQADRQLFADDRLSSYLEDEVCGREDGVEYVCETILRGRRGEVFTDIDGQRVNRARTRFGTDVTLTLDIELQQRIEQYLTDCAHNSNCQKPTAAVVIEVASGDILALVSIPNFDLNRARYDYDALSDDPNEPLINRAINKQYPPGSVVKPLILIAALESGEITADEIIPCPAQKAPKHWPSCWIYNRHRLCHSDKWENHARNAIKGSCNIYFSRLADRIEPSILQQWLYNFGYGQKVIDTRYLILDTRNEQQAPRIENRDLRQVQGQISSSNVTGTISPNERRLFGIGQGNLRATPLQVANAMAAIARPHVYLSPAPASPDARRGGGQTSVGARGGILKQPRLFKEIRNSEGGALNISSETLDIIREGMRAVVDEPGGTAYTQFIHAGFAEQDVKVYGKTGSTEKPNNAWFAGFAQDSTGRGISIALVVEGGQHGSSDAAPLARDIIQFCIEAKYIGKIQLSAE